MIRHSNRSLYNPYSPDYYLTTRRKDLVPISDSKRNEATKEIEGIRYASRNSVLLTTRGPGFP